MVDADDVRRVGLALPRSYEAFIGGRWKLKVRQLVYVAFSRDETAMGFGFPRVERDGLIASDPETFFLPPTSDLRYQWVCARLAGSTPTRCASWSPTPGGCACPRCSTSCPTCRRPRRRRGPRSTPAMGRRAPAAAPLPALARPWRRGPWAHEGARPPARRADAEAPTEVEIRDDQVYRWLAEIDLVVPEE